MGCSGNSVLGRKQPQLVVDEIHCLKIVWEACTAVKAGPYPRVPGAGRSPCSLASCVDRRSGMGSLLLPLSPALCSTCRRLIDLFGDALRPDPLRTSPRAGRVKSGEAGNGATHSAA